MPMYTDTDGVYVCYVCVLNVYLCKPIIYEHTHNPRHTHTHTHIHITYSPKILKIWYVGSFLLPHEFQLRRLWCARAHTHTHACIHVSESGAWDLSFFYTNFEVSRVDFWRRDKYKALFQALDDVGGFYRYRYMSCDMICAHALWYDTCTCHAIWSTLYPSLFGPVLSLVRHAQHLTEHHMHTHTKPHVHSASTSSSARGMWHIMRTSYAGGEMVLCIG